MEPIDTNIVIFNVNIDEQRFLSDMEKKDIHFYSMGQGKLRFVTHYDYTSEMHEYFMELLKSYKPTGVVV